MKWRLSWALEASAQARNDHRASQAFPFESVLTSCISILENSDLQASYIPVALAIFPLATSRYSTHSLLSLYYYHSFPFKL